MTNTRTKQKERTLYIILAAALAARLLLALVTEGYTYDMSCFVAWGDKLASEGPAAFYSADYFADYPPGYILVLGLVSLVRKAGQNVSNVVTYIAVIAFANPSGKLLKRLLREEFTLA